MFYFERFLKAILDSDFNMRYKLVYLFTVYG